MKFRNVSFLEHQVEEQNKQEQEKLEEAEIAIRKISDRIKNEEKKGRGLDDIDGQLLEVPNTQFKGQLAGLMVCSVLKETWCSFQ